MKKILLVVSILVLSLSFSGCGNNIQQEETQTAFILNTVSTITLYNYPKDSNCCGNGYGNYVIISHDGTYSTLYGHMQAVYVSVGDYVSAGQAIGAVGCTGFSTGFHLHFEIWENGSAVNPRNYL